MENEIVYEARVRVRVDILQEWADHFYEGSMEDALAGEFGWVNESGITIEIIKEVEK